jgi:hypothetical protein
MMLHPAALLVAAAPGISGSEAEIARSLQSRALSTYEDCLGDAAARLAPSPLSDETVYVAARHFCMEQWNTYRAFSRQSHDSDAAAADGRERLADPIQDRFQRGLAAVRAYERTRAGKMTTNDAQD